MFNKVDAKWWRSYNKKMEELDDIIARKIDVSSWEEWFAWRPVKVNGKRVWLKRVYRRDLNTPVEFDNWRKYDYGTIFDVIKDGN